MSPTLARLAADVTGGDSDAEARFWREMDGAAPLVEQLERPDGRRLVTFVWRGEAETRNVLLFSSVTGFGRLAMTRLPGTDVWYRSAAVADDVRSVYEFLPDPDVPDAESIPRANLQRIIAGEGWRRDPLNPRTFTLGPPARETSLLEMPGAWPQPFVTRGEGVPAGTIDPHRYDSARLGDARPVWTYLPPGYGESDAAYPLVLLFDGWAYLKMGGPETLDNLIAAGRIPPVVCAMVHQNDRLRELACDEGFADAMALELAPEWLASRYRIDLAQPVTVGGMSLGGLHAAFTALRHPEVFGGVLSQSGSYWWGPGADLTTINDISRTDIEWEWLTARFSEHERLPLRFYMDVGQLERAPRPGRDIDMVDSNRRMRDALLAKGYPVTYAEFPGGHDYASWRGTLADGLIALLGGAR
jgi:enterochelin esterase family protein